MAYDFRYANLNEDLSFVSLNGDSGDFADENPFVLNGSLTLEYRYADNIGGVGVYTNRANVLQGRLYFNEVIFMDTFNITTDLSHFDESYISYQFYYLGNLQLEINYLDSENTPTTYIDDFVQFDSIVFTSSFDYDDYSNHKISSIVPFASYQLGYQNGYADGNYIGKQDGYDEGYDVGYNEGFEDGYSSENTMSSLVVEVANTPLNIFKSIFNVDIMGFNLVNVCFGLISILLVVFIIKKFMGGE